MERLRKQKKEEWRGSSVAMRVRVYVLETDTVKQAWNLITDQYSALLQRDQKTSDSGLWGGVGVS